MAEEEGCPCALSILGRQRFIWGTHMPFAHRTCAEWDGYDADRDARDQLLVSFVSARSKYRDRPGRNRSLEPKPRVYGEWGKEA